MQTIFLVLVFFAEFQIYFLYLPMQLSLISALISIVPYLLFILRMILFLYHFLHAVENFPLNYQLL